MRFISNAVTIVGVVLVLIATTAPAAGDDQTKGDQTVGVSVQTPGVLAIDVDQEVALGITSPGTTTAEVGFHIGIVNSTTEGWDVYVTATDFESYTLVCDDQGGNCTKTPTDPLNAIAATNLYIRGGSAAALSSTNEMATNEGYFGVAGTPFLLLQGTSVASGTLGMDEPQTSMRLDVPANAVDGEYSATLTYTIMASTP